ncbi:hypothetical protein [Streptomyces sp. RerS4]|nr:hypothetical protein [Streptomyces sp. RerS4]
MPGSVARDRGAAEPAADPHIAVPATGPTAPRTNPYRTVEEIHP